MTELDLKMPNGASVKDWLGTARVAASAAGTEIEAARQGHPLHDDWLDKAIEHVEEARHELVEVRLALARAEAG